MPVYCEDGRWRYRKMVRFLDGAQRLGGTTPPEDNTEQRANEDHAAMILWAKSRNRPGPHFKGTPWIKATPWFEGGSDQRNHGAPVQLGGSQVGGSLLAKAVPTLAEVLPTYLASLKNDDQKSTHEGRLSRIRQYIERAEIDGVRLVDLRVDQIDTGVVDDFRTWMAAQRNTRIKSRVQLISRKTVNNGLNTLSNILVYCRDRDWIARLPKFKRLKIDRVESDFLTFEECDALIENSDAGMWQAMVMTAARVGLRRGELLALMWSDVDFDRDHICVRRSWVRGEMKGTKSRRWRFVPMGKELRALLLALRDGHARSPSALVFCEPDGSPMRLGFVQSQLERLCRQARLRRIGWHVLRHTFASHLVMRGVPLRQVQVWMGHSTIVITERYAHLAPDMAATAISKLESTPRLRRAARAATACRPEKNGRQMRREASEARRNRSVVPTVWQDQPANGAIDAAIN